MQFELPAGALARAVGMVKGCVPSKTTLPVLSHVHLEARVTDAGNGEFAVRASNLVMDAEAIVPAEVTRPGAAALPGDVLLGLAKLLGKQDTAKFAGDGQRFALQAGRSRYQISGMDPADFPLLNRPADGVRFKVDAKALGELIDCTRYAASTEETRFYLNGVFLAREEGRLVAVATDGQRLAKRTMPLPPGAEGLEGSIIPNAALREIHNLLAASEGDVEISVNKSRIAIHAGGLSFGTALIAGQFPDYNRVIPRDLDRKLTVRPAALAEAVQRASVVFAGSDEKWPAVHIIAGANGIDLKARAADREAIEDVEADVHERGAEFKCQAKYLSEMLARWPETAELNIAYDGGGSPVVFTSEAAADQLHLIMQMRK